MTELALLQPGNTLQLPERIAKSFLPADRFVVWLDGDTLVLKRVAPSPLETVANSPNGEPLSMDEINEIVHDVRRKRRNSAYG
ncbi:MAG: hypothetical protein IAE85_03875 [Anaerolinea sp.]|nr:hypothetical protein [Anaerolinea sp.]